MNSSESLRKQTLPGDERASYAAHEIVIKPRSGWRGIDLRELWDYRDLFYFLVWREIRVRYAQSVLGIGWALIQPLVMTIVFTIIFGSLVQVASDNTPYALFSLAGMVLWAFFSQSLNAASSSLVRSAPLLSKIYFPRLILPITSVLSKLVDLAIALLLLAGVMLWFQVVPTVWVLLLPLLIVIALLAALGAGMWMTALAVQYRDVNYATGFIVNILMYASPVVYPVSLVPEPYRLIYALNPMAGVIAGFRAALFGNIAIPWDMLLIGGAVALLLASSGAAYFRRVERVFADVA